MIGGAIPNVISGNLQQGVIIAGAASRDNLVANNRIGTNGDGTAALPNRVGVLINDAPQNCIGGFLPAVFGQGPLCAIATIDRSATGNVISGNTSFGVEIANPNSTATIVQGNRIGTNLAGTSAVPNGSDGVVIENGAEQTLIGGFQPSARNLISGNVGDGILIAGIAGNPSSDNRIAGNYIGVDITGESAIKNNARGVHLDHDVEKAVIGGDSVNERNLISGNGLDGIIVAFDTTFENDIKNNFIGTNKAGEVAIPNERHGIRLLNTINNNIGDVKDTSGLGNLISGNKLSGIRIEGADATRNILVNNAIGTNVGRDKALRNEEHGVHILNSPANLIGGTFDGIPDQSTLIGNVLSGNKLSGIKIEGAGADGNLVGANIIGLDGSGTRALGNLENGIHVVDVAGTRIGASLPNEITLNGNVISSNAEGIFLDGPNAKETIIGDNGIGTKWDGVPSDPVHILGNFLSGVRIRNGSENNVGGRFLENGQAFQVPGNVIAGNNVGVRIEGDSALSNRVQRNSIFENSKLGIDLGRDEVTPNDAEAMDADVGPNLLQNFPTIDRYEGFDGRLVGKLVSRPNSDFTLDLYKTANDDIEGRVEGEVWLNQFTVTTDNHGEVNFELATALDRSMKWLTLTATDEEGNTSEFSAPLHKLTFTSTQFSLNHRK